jgi:uncharacterized phiE125 gp8 family phage protein
MIIDLVTDTATEPVTLAEMKEFLKEDLTDEEDTITSLIASARKRIEDYCNITMCTKVYDMTLDGFEDRIKIPLPPCQSIDAFVYNSLTYSETAVSATKYTTFIYNSLRKSEIIKYPEQTYSDYQVPDINAIRVRFTAGYGDNASDVPDILKTAIKITVAHWFENREGVTLPPLVKNLIGNYRVMKV